MVPLSGVKALLCGAGNAPSVSTRGSFYQGGKSIPRPLLLTRHAGSGPLETAALEALALTKMDWNNDHPLYDPVPVTIRYSQVLARTITNVPSLPRAEYPYRMFMSAAVNDLAHPIRNRRRSPPRKPVDPEEAPLAVLR